MTNSVNPASSRPEPMVSGAPSGRTVIADPAVAKVAAIAAREVSGVFTLGSGGGRALGALRDAVGGGDSTQGVQVEVGEVQAAVDITLVAVYGTPLLQVADQVRAAVYQAVQALTGLEVIEVNVEINDVHVPGLNDARNIEKPRSAPAGRSGTESQVVS
ncbi:Asp23/Gls24 family envelope stress response protein [Arthrobacter roseus]|uniref:Asp23/Gls24 family envelope stress response protein n=1 Tax=Arthrobacter roseus TaxID=136274 RepID=UPI0019661344|nr:Asp23/Gls24 family envelope stress response protein [Arthrobacter roseus]MBM7847361.1 putative alkaline shock family protein YloU [Arthrobacter roseus]